MAIDWTQILRGVGNEALGNGLASLDTASKIILNSIYPSEFEVYMMSLELVDYSDNLLQFFTFPVNPESISKVEPQTKFIDKTYGAVIVNKLGQFVPQDLSIKGSFGRQFRFVVRDNSNKSKAISFSAIGQDNLNKVREFNHFYKSGYGCFKMLQSICQESNKLDNGRARRLYLHNMALGESYLVEVLSFQSSQSLSQNMIWGYDIRFKIVSEIYADSNANRSRTVKNLVSSSIVSNVNSVLNRGKSIALSALSL